MAVEEDANARIEVAEQRQAGAELIDEEGVGLQRLQLGGERDLDDDVELAQDGAKDGEAREDAGGKEGIAADADI